MNKESNKKNKNIPAPRGGVFRPLGAGHQGVFVRKGIGSADTKHNSPATSPSQATGYSRTISNKKVLNPTIYKLKAGRGFGLLEILIASAIITMTIVALSAVGHVSFLVVEESARKAQAEFLAEEGVEAVKILRDKGWASTIAPLESSTSYFLVFSTSTSEWILHGSNPGPIDGIFSREVIFEDVYRGTYSDDIVPAGSSLAKYLDGETREVISRVSGLRIDEVEIRTYITNLFNN